MFTDAQFCTPAPNAYQVAAGGSRRVARLPQRLPAALAGAVQLRGVEFVSRKLRRAHSAVQFLLRSKRAAVSSNRASRSGHNVMDVVTFR
jgi:hypothetical protein